MKKILLGRTKDAVYAMYEFPKDGDVSILAYKLSKKTVEEYIFSGNGCAGIMNEISKNGEEIKLTDFARTFQPSMEVYGSGKTYYSNGKPEADAPKVLFTRKNNKTVGPYGYKEKMPKETSKLTAEAELVAIVDEVGKIVGYAYGADPTTREMHADGEKSGIKSGNYPISFAVLTEDNKPLQDEATYEFKGEYLSRSFNCNLHYTGNKTTGIYFTEQELVDYLYNTGVKDQTIKGPCLLLVGNPADQALRVENDTDLGNKEKQTEYAKKVVETLETGLSQKLLINNKLLFEMNFSK